MKLLIDYPDLSLSVIVDLLIMFMLFNNDCKWFKHILLPNFIISYDPSPTF